MEMDTVTIEGDIIYPDTEKENQFYHKSRSQLIINEGVMNISNMIIKQDICHEMIHNQYILSVTNLSHTPTDAIIN